MTRRRRNWSDLSKSPTMIAGLRRLATSLWLHFVASPQRMPVFDHRRWRQPVVNVIDKSTSRSSNTSTSAKISRLRTSGSIRSLKRHLRPPPTSRPRAPIHHHALYEFSLCRIRKSFNPPKVDQSRRQHYTACGYAVVKINALCPKAIVRVARMV